MSRKNKDEALPCVLILAGLDPSGGAGLAADQRACLAMNAWPLPVATVITVQSTAGLESVHPLPATLVQQQARAVLRHQFVQSVKIGALGSEPITRSVLELLRTTVPHLPVVLDPVLSSTTNDTALLPSDARRALDDLIGSCAIITPNRREATVLSGIEVHDDRTARLAAIRLLDLGPRAVLVKGGHLSGPRAIDWLATRSGVFPISSQRLPMPEVHGTGCTLASLIAGALAHQPSPLDDQSILRAVRRAKRRMSSALHHPRTVGSGLRVLPLQ